MRATIHSPMMKVLLPSFLVMALSCGVRPASADQLGDCRGQNPAACAAALVRNDKGFLSTCELGEILGPGECVKYIEGCIADYHQAGRNSGRNFESMDKVKEFVEICILEPVLF